LGLGRSLDRHRLAGPRVATGRGLALGHRERSETDQAYLVALLEGSRNGVENALDRLCGIAPRQPARVCDRTDQFVLVHRPSFPLMHGKFCSAWIRRAMGRELSVFSFACQSQSPDIA